MTYQAHWKDIARELDGYFVGESRRSSMNDWDQELLETGEPTSADEEMLGANEPTSATAESVFSLPIKCNAMDRSTNLLTDGFWQFSTENSESDQKHRQCFIKFLKTDSPHRDGKFVVYF